MTPDPLDPPVRTAESLLRDLIDSCHVAEMRPATAADLAPVPAAPLHSSAVQIDYLTGVLWAAREMILRWDAAGVLGLGTRTGAGVHEILTALQGLRTALARETV
jgi:hypothetical protein